MKILYLSFDGILDPLGQSQILPYLKGLANAGYEIHLITLEKKEVGRKEKEKIEGSGIKYFFDLYAKNPKGLSFLKNKSRMRRIYKRLAVRISFDLIHTRSLVPYEAIKSLLPSGSRVLFDMRGFWPDERVDGKIWNIKNPLFFTAYRSFKNKEQYLVSHADSIISLTENARNEIGTWFETGSQRGSLQSFKIKTSNRTEGIKEKIHVIPTCVDTDHFNPEKYPVALKAKKRREFDLPNDHLVFCYQGSFGTWYLFEEMFDFFMHYNAHDPNSSWLILTKEPKGNIRKRVEVILERNPELGSIDPVMDKIRIRSSSYDRMPQDLLAADAGLFFISGKFSKKASSATKTGEFVSMGLPVISNPGWGDMEHYHSKYPWAFWLENGDTKGQNELRSWIESASGEKIRDLAIREFSLQMGIESYSRVYKSIQD